MGIGGWGIALGKLADWIPGRKESKRKKIKSIKRKLNEIQDKPKPLTKYDRALYQSLTDKLRTLEESIQEI